MQLVEESGGIVAGVGVLVDRSNGQVDFGVKQRAVVTMEVLSWDATECPLCGGGSEPVKPGSRK
jgi:orotate phosphoribosyltransferase